MATAATLMMERNGRCSRLAKTSLFMAELEGDAAVFAPFPYLQG
jgi:hypothetical protein